MRRQYTNPTSATTEILPTERETCEAAKAIRARQSRKRSTSPYQALTVYDGRLECGVVRLIDGRWYATGTDNTLLGDFASQQDAIAVVWEAASWN